MRRPLTTSILIVAFAFAFASVPVAAGDAPTPATRALDKTIITSDGFLGAHPDMKYRLTGLRWFAKQDWDRAHEDFRRAARYGDKPAQGMIGEMYWSGTGVAADRPTAYAWMDLAAERGYPLLLAKRERYWAALDASERALALTIGEQLYAEFGDDVAKPRLERELRKARRSLTGSRVGSVGSLTIHIPTPGGTRQVDGSQFWAEKFWAPAEYWAWQDADWKVPASGEVTVGDVMSLPPDPAE